jgi:mycothiol synthase
VPERHAEPTYRRPSTADARAVTDLINACSIEETGVPSATVEEILADWTAPGADPGRDCWVVEAAGGDLIGSMWVGAAMLPSLRIDGYVHPSHRGRGIGTRLLTLGLDRSREMSSAIEDGSPVTVLHGVLHGSHGARLLEAHGFDPVRRILMMRIDMDGPPPAPAWPEWISVRTAVAGQDERAIYAAEEEAFQDHWNHRPVGFDDWLHARTVGGADLDRTMWFLAMDGGQLAGAALCAREVPEDVRCGLVDRLSVRRPWRRNGIAMALLQHAFGEFRRRGTASVALFVDAESLTGATRLYERAGMRAVRQIDAYEKELRPGRPT